MRQNILQTILLLGLGRLGRNPSFHKIGLLFVRIDSDCPLFNLTLLLTRLNYLIEGYCIMAFWVVILFQVQLLLKDYFILMGYYVVFLGVVGYFRNIPDRFTCVAYWSCFDCFGRLAYFRQGLLLYKFPISALKMCSKPLHHSQ